MSIPIKQRYFVTVSDFDCALIFHICMCVFICNACGYCDNKRKHIGAQTINLMRLNKEKAESAIEMCRSLKFVLLFRFSGVIIYEKIFSVNEILTVELLWIG